MDSETLPTEYEKRTNMILQMYTQRFRTNILEVMENYNADYVILSNKLNNYNIKFQETIFFSDPCFDLVYNGEIKVFEKCAK